MISMLFSNPLFFFFWVFALLVAVTIHEYAHAYVADRLGDPTPRSQGRLTLDPRAHLDPIGTLTLLFFGFGWGKPVQFDIFNLQNPKKDTGMIALAGPISNVSLAVIISFLYKLLLPASFAPLIVLIISMNIMLAVFNLIPIYPLDGQKILTAILPRDLAREFNTIMRQYGTIILLFLIWPFSGVSLISALITPAIRFFLGILL